MQTINHKNPKDRKQIALVSFKTMRFVKQHEIIYLQSDNCYTNIYLIDNSKHLMCKTLKNYEEELDNDLFFRCHKSYLINRLFIKEIIKECGEYLILTTGTKIPIARRKSLELKLFNLHLYR